MKPKTETGQIKMNKSSILFSILGVVALSVGIFSSVATSAPSGTKLAVKHGLDIPQNEPKNHEQEPIELEPVVIVAEAPLVKQPVRRAQKKMDCYWYGMYNARPGQQRVHICEVK